MGLLNMFGDRDDHRTFNYHPMYYDEEAEKRRQMFGKVDGRDKADASDEASSDGEKKSGYTPGGYLRGAFRNGNYERRRSSGGKARAYLNIIGLLLVAAILIYLTKFFSIL